MDCPDRMGCVTGYRASEVYRGGSISKEADVYSIGATLFHLATGVRPVDEQDMDPRSSGVMVPQDLRELILAACRPVPSTRPTVAATIKFLDTKAWPPRADPAKELLVGVGILGGILLIAAALADS